MSELSVGTLSGLAANSYVVDVAAGSTLDLSNATDLPASALPAGSILQVVENFYATPVTTTSPSYVTTNLTATITPRSTSSKILAFAISTFLNPGSHIVTARLFRGTVAGTEFGSETHLGSAASIGASMTVFGLDSPSTTSSQIYTLGFKTTGGTAQAQYDSKRAQIILMEVAG